MSLTVGSCWGRWRGVHLGPRRSERGKQELSLGKAPCKVVTGWATEVRRPGFKLKLLPTLVTGKF